MIDSAPPFSAARPLPLCPSCLDSIGGAAAGPDAPYRPRAYGEACGAAGCAAPGAASPWTACAACGEPGTVLRRLARHNHRWHLCSACAGAADRDWIPLESDPALVLDWTVGGAREVWRHRRRLVPWCSPLVPAQARRFYAEQEWPAPTVVALYPLASADCAYRGELPRQHPAAWIGLHPHGAYPEARAYTAGEVAEDGSLDYVERRVWLDLLRCDERASLPAWEGAWRGVLAMEETR